MSGREELLLNIENRQGELQKMTMYLTEMESQIALIFAASPDMIVFLHKDGKIVKISQAVKKVLGYEQEELKGRLIWEFIHPDDVEKTKNIRTALLGDRTIYSDNKNFFINRWLKKDGTYAKLSWRFTIYDELSDHTIGFATDVTNLVLENPANFRLLHRAIGLVKDGIIITDNHESDNLIIYVNESYCKNCGYTKDEIIGKNPIFLQSNDPDQAALHTIRDAIKTGEGCEVLLKNFRKDKSIFFNHILISPIIDDGIVTNYIGISRDLTGLINEGVYIWDRTAPRGFGKLK